jgi:hypothetical protein
MKNQENEMTREEELQAYKKIKEALQAIPESKRGTNWNYCNHDTEQRIRALESPIMNDNYYSAFGSGHADD